MNIKEKPGIIAIVTCTLITVIFTAYLAWSKSSCESGGGEFRETGKFTKIMNENVAIEECLPKQEKE